MWLRPYPQHHPHPPRLHTRWDLQTFTTILTYQVMFAHKESSPFDQSLKKGAPFSGEIGSPFESRWDALLFQPGLKLFGHLFPIPKCSYPKSLIILICATINPVVIHQTEWSIIPLQVWSTPFGSPWNLTQRTLRPDLTLPIPQMLKSSMKIINFGNGQWQLELFEKGETLLQISWMFACLTL